MINNYYEFETDTRYQYCQEMTIILRHWSVNLSEKQQYHIFRYLAPIFAENICFEIDAMPYCQQIQDPLGSLADIIEESIWLPLEVAYAEMMDLLMVYKDQGNWDFLPKLKKFRIYVVNNNHEFYLN